jgi:hypothetical protein
LAARFAAIRMHRVGAGDLAGREQRRDVEIAVAGGRRADADALVGEADMHRVRIRGRVHRDCCNAEFLARAQHTQRDLSAVGDQDFIEHAAAARKEIATGERTRRLSDPIRCSPFAIRASLHSMIISGSPYSTG